MGSSRRVFAGFVPLGLFVIIALLLHELGLGCPIKVMTGVSCPGCGMTRAWISLLGLQVREAVAYHPLFWTFPLAIAIGVCEGGSKGVSKALVGCLICALLVLWIVRLVDTQDATLLVQSGVQGDIVSIQEPAWMRVVARLFA